VYTHEKDYIYHSDSGITLKQKKYAPPKLDNYSENPNSNC
jgi:hypothetical protein